MTAVATPSAPQEALGLEAVRRYEILDTPAGELELPAHPHESEA